MADSAKTAVAEAYQSADMPGVASAATTWNAAFTVTKYVSGIIIDGPSGAITIKYGANTPQISGLTVQLQPYIAQVALKANQTGNIDWGCASTNDTTLLAQGLPAPAVLGTVPARYVPTSCK